MAENNDLTYSRQRRRRDASKRSRDSIYCYNTQEYKESEKQISEDLQPIIHEKDDDDSFTYNGIKKKKTHQKNLKTKPKAIQKILIKKSDKKGKKQIQDKRSQPYSQKHIQGVTYVENIQYVPKAKQLPENKIFNPDLYYDNIALKTNLENQLQSLYEKFGRKQLKQQEPQQKVVKWKYLIKQIEEAGKDFASEREERYKLKRKIAKISQGTCSRLQQIKEQKVKDEEKKVRKQALELLKHVKKEFWGSAHKVRKICLFQERKKQERENKMKKLEDLVSKQFEASQKITKILQGYKQVSLDNIKVSQNTKVPVIIDIDRTPSKYKYIGLHQDNVIRPSLLIKFPLRQYQLLGVYWISTLHNRGMNAILADQMGLGKTIQTIAFLAHLAIQKGIWGPHLIIVPTTILMNWEIQFKRWCPAFKIMTYFGSPKERKQKRKGWSKLNSFHVCITSYKIAVTDHPIFKRKKWYYMILDEAQNIKNFKSQRWQILLNFKTKNRLLLTGTPLQNDLTELWSLLHFLMPRIFNSFDDFNEWFNIPFQEALEKNFPISQQILKKLHTVLRPFFLRRLKKDVQTQLPTKTEKIVRCSMSRRQKYLYDQMIWHQNKRTQQKQESTGGMMNVLIGLKKICNHPDLFQPRIEQSPLNWVPLTVVIAHHMFLKSHFETYKTHVLKDFIEGFRENFHQIIEDILSQYDKFDINEDNEVYYRNKIADRLRFAKVNYERSRRKQFKIYQFAIDGQSSPFYVNQTTTPYFMTHTLEQKIQQFEPIFDKFVFVVPKVMARPASLATFPMNSEVQSQINRLDYLRQKVKTVIPRDIECIRSRFLLHFPNKNILLYDSGKLIKMIFLLKAIKYRGQKALIFTQMTKMLDIFQKVLNMFKFNYVRLDGNTKTELRQTVVERFNNDPRVLCFISSTRSGGIGLNLTGASNVIFYDTDWNPAMDKQAQDRCHRIGQTRNVIIYRLITEHSIEENILMKSIQKRKLESLVTEEGGFDTSYFEKVSLKGLLKGAIDYREDYEANLADVEDVEDQEMLHLAEKEKGGHGSGGAGGGQVWGNKDNEVQEELDVEMLPSLFQYGLKRLEYRDDNDQEDDDDQQEDDSDEENSESNESVNQEESERVVNKKKVRKVEEKVEQTVTVKEKKSKIERLQEKKQAKEKVQSQKVAQQLTKKSHNKGKGKMRAEQSAAQEQEDYQQQEEDSEQIQEPQEEPTVLNYSITTLDKLKSMAIYQSEYLFMKKHFFSVHEQQSMVGLGDKEHKIEGSEGDRVNQVVNSRKGNELAANSSHGVSPKKSAIAGIGGRKNGKNGRKRRKKF